jgi:hypothetical protein
MPSTACVRRTVPTIPANDEAPQERSSAGQWEHAHDRSTIGRRTIRRRPIIYSADAFKATKPRKRGLAHTRFHRATLALIEQVNAVITEYAEYVPLTIRQIFYRLVGAHGYEKTENAYSLLCSHISNARRDGLIDFEHIRDDGLTDLSLPTWISGLHMIANFTVMAQDFRLDRQRDQDTRLMF